MRTKTEKSGARMSTGKLVKRFVPYYKPYWKTMTLDLLCAAATTVCELIFPLIVQYITDNLAILTVRIILAVGAVYLAARVVDTAANFFMASVGHVMGARIETDMRRDLFGHLQKLSYSYYDNTKIGQIMARITSDLFDVTEFAHHCPEEFFIAGLKMIASFVILCFYNVSLTLIIFALIPVMILCSVHFNLKMRGAFKRSREQTGELNAQVEDSLLGIRVVKSFANEDVEEAKFERGNSRFLGIKKEAYRFMAGFQSTTRLFDGIMYIVVVVAGALFLIAGKITAGNFIAYLLFVTTLLASVRRIVEFAEQFQRGMTGIERFLEVVDAPVEITDTENAEELAGVRGEISFERVSFRYNENERDILTGIDLRVSPGENVALVGPSGSGKTTLCNLITRFYEVSAGRILLDGKDIREIKLQSLRSNIGMVQQDVYLFSGTVRENIAYGRPGASDEEIVEAAKNAGAHDFILKLEQGYDTYIGERGIKLSGGQKQRLSIARVFLKNPPILIMDEATSALDNESERIVQESLGRLARGRTTFTIAHRLTTIKNADTILVLTENGIEERGTHAELVEKGGIYSGLYRMYADFPE